jgi:IS30 family transposase
MPSPSRKDPQKSKTEPYPVTGRAISLAALGTSHIVTLVERHSRFTALVKVPSKDTIAVVAALSRQVRKLPASLRRSLTWDCGLEMAKHKTFTMTTNVKVYFCDPQSPWNHPYSQFPEADFPEAGSGAVNARRLIRLASHFWRMPCEL